jgi:hypothetical protein
MNSFKNSLNILKNRTSSEKAFRFSPTEKLLLLIVVFFCFICCWTAYIGGFLWRIKFLLYGSLSIAMLPFIVGVFGMICCFKILWWKATIRPSPLFRTWWPMLTQGLLPKERFLHAVPTFIALVIFLSIFSNMKGLISCYVDYSWDPFLAELDKKLHFGKDPWRWLQPLLGYPLITAALNVLYNIWLPIMGFFLYWQLLSLKAPLLRLQFFYTYIFTWSISGTFFAILFASGGPCFYAMMTGSDYFAEQVSYLRLANEHYTVGALRLQDMVLKMYQEDKITVGVGISAMPSMHVATAFLYYLVTSNLNKWVGRIFAVYCFLILLGSVHLAWHYAVDGYFSFVSTWVYWRFSGFLVREAEEGRALQFLR